MPSRLSCCGIENLREAFGHNGVCSGVVGFFNDCTIVDLGAHFLTHRMVPRRDKNAGCAPAYPAEERHHGPISTAAIYDYCATPHRRGTTSAQAGSGHSARDRARQAIAPCSASRNGSGMAVLQGVLTRSAAAVALTLSSFFE